MFSNAMRWVLLVVFVFTVGGCGNDQTVLQTNTQPNAIVTGRVIDSSTRQPVGGAEVTLLCNGTKLSATSSNSTDPALAGTFVFNGVISTASYSSGYELNISAPGYAIYQDTVGVPASTDNMPVSVTLGNIALGKGCDVTAIVTDNGIPVPAVVVFASDQYGSYTRSAISAVTDVNGIATLKGLNQEASYQIMTAPKYDTNGNIVYPASTPYYSYQPQNSARTISISLKPAMRDDAIQIIGSNLLSDGSTSSNQKVMKSDSVITIVFNYPVELTGSVSATYVNNLVPSSDPDYGKVLSVTTLSGSLDSTGTMLTVANSSPYIRNQSYTFNMPITATVNGQKHAYDFSTTPFFSNPVYITNDSSSGLSPTTTLKADNFNGTSGATATSSSAYVYIEFPEKVFGSYRVISTKNGTTVSTSSNYSATFGFSDGAMVYASNSGGADGAVVFKLPLYYGGVYLPDNRSASPSEVTISFDVMDAEGIRFNNTVTLPVQ